jgi:DNA-directed RNA polymerase subunit RPC12/RpoP
LCGKSYSRLRTLQQHVQAHTAEKNVVCEICGFKTIEKGRMNRHMKSHEARRIYPCDICGKMFIYTYNVTLHKKLVHFGWKQKPPSEEKLTCNICHRRFPQIKKCKDHMRDEHGVMGTAEDLN